MQQQKKKGGARRGAGRPSGSMNETTKSYLEALSIMKILEADSPLESAVLEAEALMKSKDFEAAAQKYKQLLILFLGCLTVRPKISAAFHRHIIAKDKQILDRMSKHDGDDI